MILAARQTNNEVYTFKEMLKENDRAEFGKAMTKETEVHERRGNWMVVPRSSMPSNMYKDNTVNLGI